MFWTGLLVDCNQQFTELSGIEPEDLNDWSMFGLIKPEELQETYGWVARVLHSKGEEDFQDSRRLDEVNNNSPNSLTRHRNDSTKTAFKNDHLLSFSSSSATANSSTVSQLANQCSRFSSSFECSLSSSLQHCSTDTLKVAKERPRSGVETRKDLASQIYAFPLESHTLAQRAVPLPCSNSRRTRSQERFNSKSQRVPSKSGESKDLMISNDKRSQGREQSIDDVQRFRNGRRNKSNMLLSISFVRDSSMRPIYFHLAFHDSKEICG